MPGIIAALLPQLVVFGEVLSPRLTPDRIL